MGAFSLADYQNNTNNRLQEYSDEADSKAHTGNMVQKYTRLQRGCVTDESRQKYGERLRAWEHKQTSLHQETVAKSEKSGIIIERTMSNGLRKSPHHILTDEEIDSIKVDAESLKIPMEILNFNQGVRTSFDEQNNCINIKGDILPDLNSKNIRDLLSSKAVLAHEYYGHYKNHPSSFAINDWRDEFRASYQAAIYAPNLSDEERKMLMLDAYDRAKESGVSVNYNKKARRIIHGYDK